MHHVLTEVNSITEGLEAAGTEIPVVIYATNGPWLKESFNPRTDYFLGTFGPSTAAWDLWGDLQRLPGLRPYILNAVCETYLGAGGYFFQDETRELLVKATKWDGDCQSAADSIATARNPGNCFASVVRDEAHRALHKLAQIEFRATEARKIGISVLSIDSFLSRPGRLFLLNDAVNGQRRDIRSIFLTAFILRALSRPDTADGRRKSAVIVEGAQGVVPPRVYEELYARGASRGLRLIVASSQRSQLQTER